MTLFISIQILIQLHEKRIRIWIPVDTKSEPRNYQKKLKVLEENLLIHKVFVLIIRQKHCDKNIKNGQWLLVQEHGQNHEISIWRLATDPSPK